MSGVHWLLEAKIGVVHVQVAVRAGATDHDRPLLGTLTMDLTQWEEFRDTMCGLSTPTEGSTAFKEEVVA